jgi:hypothetical protein
MNEFDSRHKLTHAYDRMMERVKHSLDIAEQKTVLTLEHAIHAARDRAVELGEISREEAEKVAEFLYRDLHNIGVHLNETGTELRTWLHMDLELIEARLLELINGLADPTRLALAQFAVSAHSPSIYRTGEISGPGTLQCMACGESLRFVQTGHIPSCPKCHKTEFVRLIGPTSSDD